MFLLCLKIFFARILDVTLGTIKTVHIVNGNKLKSTIINILIMLLIVKVIIFLIIRMIL